MSDLRMRVVEAGARAMEGHGLLGARLDVQAEAALDAMLDCLAESADEPFRDARVSVNEIRAQDLGFWPLLAVLREDR